jgi:hypothetical protein
MVIKTFNKGVKWLNDTCFMALERCFQREKLCFWMFWNWNSYAKVMNSQNYRICNLGKLKLKTDHFKSFENLPIQCCPCYHLQNII